MIDHALLPRAVTRGLLTPARVDGLARENAGSEPVRAEGDARSRFIKDFADRPRRTRDTDVAFRRHLPAAPPRFLALGAFVLLPSAGWHGLRGAVLRGLPMSLTARPPHPIGAR